MLAEKLLSIGCKIIQANTDGLFILRKKKDENKFKEVCKQWETLTKLELEEDRFEAFYQYAINDYLGVVEGYSKTKNPKLLKKKGLFIDKVSLGKGMNAMIIPKAISAYLIDKIPIEDTIKSCRNLNDFITYQKVSRDFEVEYNEQLIQRINRYYCATNGYYLYKCKVDKDGNRNGYINMLKSSSVILCNNLDDFKEFPNNINYQYYIAEANKIIAPLITKQLTLF